MPTLIEIRTTLLQQHEDLRARVEETRSATAKWQQGQTEYAQVRGCLARLTSALRTHNAAEEEALHALLPTLDPWGPIRTEVMLDEHVAEHTEIYATLIEASSSDDAASAATAILKLLDTMLKHMAHEEKVFLSAEVLTEDVTTDGFGG